MTGRVIIHIGLHKTGTRFLQRMVFKQLDSQQFLYNPDWLLIPLRHAVRERDDPTTEKALGDAVGRWRAGNDERTLIISEPHASGDMYGMHEGAEHNASMLARLFPEAQIIYFVRRHADWLQSAYRQGLVKDPGQPIQRFLNFYDGVFHEQPARRVAGKRNLSALGLRFLGIYRAYTQAFGTSNVYLLRQESLRQRPEDVRAVVARALGLSRLPEPPHERSQNRSFSALAILMLFPATWLLPWKPPERMIGRGVGPWRRPLRPLRSLRTNLIRHGLDRLVYIDWDLLARDGMRQRIEAHYADEQAVIERIGETILDSGPEAIERTPIEGNRPESGFPRG